MVERKKRAGWRSQDLRNSKKVLWVSSSLLYILDGGALNFHQLQGRMRQAKVESSSAWWGDVSESRGSWTSTLFWICILYSKEADCKNRRLNQIQSLTTYYSKCLGYNQKSLAMVCAELGCRSLTALGLRQFQNLYHLGIGTCWFPFLIQVIFLLPGVIMIFDCILDTLGTMVPRACDLGNPWRYYQCLHHTPHGRSVITLPQHSQGKTYQSSHDIFKVGRSQDQDHLFLPLQQVSNTIRKTLRKIWL